MEDQKISAKIKRQRKRFSEHDPKGSSFSSAKFIVLVSTTILVSIAFFLLADNYRAVLLQLSPPDKRLALIWKWDIERLSEQQKLPKEWSLIRKIKLVPSDRESERILSTIAPPPIPHNENEGEYDLEVRLFSWTENEYFGVIVQYELFKVKDQNKIWELGRTFELGRGPRGPSAQSLKETAQEQGAASTNN